MTLRLQVPDEFGHPVNHGSSDATRVQPLYVLRVDELEFDLEDCLGLFRETLRLGPLRACEVVCPCAAASGAVEELLPVAEAHEYRRRKWRSAFARQFGRDRELEGHRARARWLYDEIRDAFFADDECLVIGVNDADVGWVRDGPRPGPWRAFDGPAGVEFGVDAVERVCGTSDGELAVVHVAASEFELRAWRRFGERDDGRHLGDDVRVHVWCHARVDGESAG